MIHSLIIIIIIIIIICSYLIKRSHADLPTNEVRHLLSPASAVIYDAFHVSSFSTICVCVCTIHAYIPLIALGGQSSLSFNAVRS